MGTEGAAANGSAVFVAFLQERTRIFLKKRIASGNREHKNLYPFWSGTVVTRTRGWRFVLPGGAA
jgi:hypothetical protein